MDAWGRCFGGVPGYLATVDDAAENAFLLGKMLAHQGRVGQRGLDRGQRHDERGDLRVAGWF